VCVTLDLGVVEFDFLHKIFYSLLSFSVLIARSILLNNCIFTPNPYTMTLLEHTTGYKFDKASRMATDYFN
jgi:hypothetical protein